MFYISSDDSWLYTVLSSRYVVPYDDVFTVYSLR